MGRESVRAEESAFSAIPVGPWASEPPRPPEELGHIPSCRPRPGPCTLWGQALTRRTSIGSDRKGASLEKEPRKQKSQSPCPRTGPQQDGSPVPQHSTRWRAACPKPHAAHLFQPQQLWPPREPAYLQDIRTS